MPGKRPGLPGKKPAPTCVTIKEQKSFAFFLQNRRLLSYSTQGSITVTGALDENAPPTKFASMALVKLT
jgi:hypothetical protein